VRSVAHGAAAFEPVLIYSATPGRGVARTVVLVLLGVAPLAIGSMYPPAYMPLLGAIFLVGLYSLHRERHLAQTGVRLSAVPGRRLLLLVLALGAAQLIPLPPWLLAVVSPGSLSLRNDVALVSLGRWYPITASPPDTLRGLVFLAAMILLYMSVYREFDHPLWRRRLAKTVALVGFAMTIEALVQQAYTRNLIYGVYKPRWDWAVFGPYVNRNLFAGYMLMAVPLGAGLAAEALEDLRRAWGRRRRGWLALGDAEASAFLRWVAVAMLLVVGLLATRSRGALLGLVVWAVVVPLMSRHRLLALVAVGLVAALGLMWVGLDFQMQAFHGRGYVDSARFLIWRNSLGLVPLHPLFGSGFNAFGSALPPRQTVFRTEWIGTTHNEYLQVLVDLGIVGFLLFGRLLVVLVRQIALTAKQSAFHAGLFGSLIAVLAHNLVDCNWQIAANAATFAALAGIAMQPVAPSAPVDRPRPADRQRTEVRATIERPGR
jgi:O-antigen ligase